MKLSDFMDAEAVAWKLEIHPESVRRLARLKKLDSFKFMGQWLFEPAAIEEFSKTYNGKARYHKNRYRSSRRYYSRNTAVPDSVYPEELERNRKKLARIIAARRRPIPVGRGKRDVPAIKKEANDV